MKFFRIFIMYPFIALLEIKVIVDNIAHPDDAIIAVACLIAIFITSELFTNERKV